MFGGEPYLTVDRKIIIILGKKKHIFFKFAPLSKHIISHFEWSEQEQPSDDSGAAGAQNEKWTYRLSHVVMSGWKELWCPPVFTTVR